ncbi:MAG: hypothetical protein HOI49_02840 [Bacteroidetes bacterium]|jgi:hypothetical protein|nr:hypothetical protein [Bacteroidota bacterium]
MKSYFKNLFNQLESEDFSYTKPIKRGDSFPDDMCHSFHGIQNRILYLQQEWEAAKSMDDDISTYVIERKDAAGIVIKITDGKQEKYCHYLMDYIKGVLLQHDYHLHVNRHVAERTSGSSQESWHYFLKPKPNFDETNKQVQMFGNVIIETKKDAKGGLQFKLQCNYYSGFNYVDPLSFGEFLASL